MVECIYKTEVLLNSPKEKILTIVLYGTIIVKGVEVCKIPLEIDALANEAYYITLDYEVFIKSWEQQRFESSRKYVEQLIGFYQRTEQIKEKMNHRKESM
jgi:hypothetical protein